MQMKVFSIYDMDAEAYNQPFQMLTQNEAIRAAISQTLSPDHLFTQFPHRFELFQIAVFDNVEGRYTEKMESLGTIASLNKEDKVPDLFPVEEKTA